MSCTEHGDSDATMVCVHIVKTLRDRKPRGFLWASEEDAGYQALCKACNEMPFEKWRRNRMKNVAVVCFECFRVAAALNDIEIGAKKTRRAKK